MAYGKVEDVVCSEVTIETGHSQAFVQINWAVKECGFGQCIMTSKDGILQMETERLDKEAIKAIVCKAIDDAVIVD